jgi:DNA helicase-2/ATP-dependent DNA helicase PcrA
MSLPWMDELNPAQRQAATCPNGPVLVIAGAGTGKTKTLASRVAWLIEQGVAPSRILLLTFTRRAAGEMIARAGRITGRGTSGQVWGGTFHATANRLLRQYGRAIGLSPDFTVMDQADSADMMNLIRGELGFGKSRRRFPRKNTLIAIYSRSVNSRTKLSPMLENHFPWCHDAIDGIRQIFATYTQKKREQHVLDYDDLLLFWNALCLTPDTGAAVADRFDHILVDEYQDTNTIQAQILQAMRPGTADKPPNIMVVGDDAQSIYSFRAATVRNILDFPKHFPTAAIIKLEENYRSVEPILAATNAVMAQAKQRYTKNLFTQRTSAQKPCIITCLDEPTQCQEVCDRVLEKHEEGIALREQAVLFRAGHHSDQLEIELTRRNIPFVKYGGLKFIESAHIKDLLAVLRVLENPADQISWYRLLQLLEGIGPVSAQRIIACLNQKAPNNVHQHTATDSDNNAAQLPAPLYNLLHHPPPVPAAAREEFAAMGRAIADCLGPANSPTPLSPASQVERIRRVYEPIFHRLYDNPVVRLRDIDQLEQIAGNYKTRSQFIMDLTLDPPSSTQDLAGPPLLDEDYLILSTIHSAKGCEWDVVHIIHVADGMIPSDMATGSEDEIEEERRLLYVAMTRARDTLNLYFPLRYYYRNQGLRDRHSYAQLTRFIPESAQHLFDRGGGVKQDEAQAQLATHVGTTQAVDVMLNDLWRD